MKMIDPKIKEDVLEALNQVFSDRYHSLAQYILDASPYVASADKPLLHEIEQMAIYDQTEAERLADVIEALEGVPQVQPYSHRFAELNYLSLGYIKGFLVEKLDEQLAAYEALEARTAAFPDAETALLAVCRALRGHLGMLRNTIPGQLSAGPEVACNDNANIGSLRPATSPVSPQ